MTLQGNEQYNNGQSAWDVNNLNKYIYTYEGATSKMLIKISQFWDIGTSQFVNQNRITYSYLATGIKESDVKGLSFINSKTSIMLISNQNGFLNVYNLQGELYEQFTIVNGENIIYKRSLAKGILIFKLIVGNNTQIIKVLNK